MRIKKILTMLPQAVCTTGAEAGVGACSDIPTWADWVLGYLVGTCWPARDRQFSSQPSQPWHHAVSEIPIPTTPSKRKNPSVSTKPTTVSRRELSSSGQQTGQAGFSAHVPDAVCCNATGLQVPGCLLLAAQGVFTTNTAIGAHRNPPQHVLLLDRADGHMSRVTSWAK